MGEAVHDLDLIVEADGARWLGNGWRDNVTGSAIPDRANNVERVVIGRRQITTIITNLTVTVRYLSTFLL